MDWQILGIIAAAVCLFDVPFFIVASVLRRCRFEELLDLSGLVSVLLAASILIALHCARIPITRTSLACAYAAFLCMGVAALAATWRSRSFDAWIPRDGVFTWSLIGVAILFLPFTNLPGIDTYKWQDLATAVSVDRSIPWLAHPLSLLGFTARSYPSAQPLVLATTQITGALGVHGGYYLVSLLCAMVGLSSSRRLARTMGLSDTRASLAALIYVLSPVFMRYTHWATGRGMFLAFMPLFVSSLLEFPRPGAILRAVFSGLVIGLSHKTGLVALVVVPPLIGLGYLMPASRLAGLAAGTVALGAGMLIAPNMLLPRPLGSVVGLTYFSVTRFAWLLPGAAAAFLNRESWTQNRRTRQLAAALIVTLPFAFHSRIYGAMLCLPFLSIFAAMGLFAAADRFPVWGRRIIQTGIALSLVGGIGIVAFRSFHAAPQEVRMAADLLEAYDPAGPYELIAPGLARRQIQGYVSGCPRIRVTRSDVTEIALARPPSLFGDPRQITQDWISYLRGFLSVPDIQTDWYGENPRRYYVVIAGKGDLPQNAERILKDGPVEIYAPGGQAPPTGEALQTRGGT